MRWLDSTSNIQKWHRGKLQNSKEHLRTQATQDGRVKPPCPSCRLPWVHLDELDLVREAQRGNLALVRLQSLALQQRQEQLQLPRHKAWDQVQESQEHELRLRYADEFQRDLQELLVAAQPVMLWVCMLPRSRIQGGAYPSKESVLLAVGQMQDLIGAAAFLLNSRRCEWRSRWRRMERARPLTRCSG